MKTALFVLFLPAYCVGAIVWWGINDPFGPPEARHLQALTWVAVTPMRPSAGFPTSQLYFNMIIAYGVNAVVWSWVGSLAVATILEAMLRQLRRVRPAATSPADRQTRGQRSLS